jgi:DNA-binding NarL/FixJ family response regulator
MNNEMAKTESGVRPGKPTVVIAEDEMVIREGWLWPTVEPLCEIVAAVGDGQEALLAAEQHKPALVLLDISLPTLNGIQAARRILQSLPETKIIFVSNYAEPAYAEEAFRLGAKGYVLKSRIVLDLPQAIEAVLAGSTFQSKLQRAAI